MGFAALPEGSASPAIESGMSALGSDLGLAGATGIGMTPDLTAAAAGKFGATPVTTGLAGANSAANIYKALVPNSSGSPAPKGSAPQASGTALPQWPPFQLSAPGSIVQGASPGMQALMKLMQSRGA